MVQMEGLNKNNGLKRENKMTKQEFLNYSLVTGLKILSPDKKTIKELSGMHGTSLLFTENRTTTYGSMSCSLPICRPLSDLTKSIEHDGEVFVPIEILREMNDGYDIFTSAFGVSIDNDYGCAYNLNIAFSFIQQLIKWKFDIANLIEKGEAVDINTLENFKY